MIKTNGKYMKTKRHKCSKSEEKSQSMRTAQDADAIAPHAETSNEARPRRHNCCLQVLSTGSRAGGRAVRGRHGEADHRGQSQLAMKPRDGLLRGNGGLLQNPGGGVTGSLSASPTGGCCCCCCCRWDLLRNVAGGGP